MDNNRKKVIHKINEGINQLALKIYECNDIKEIRKLLNDFYHIKYPLVEDILEKVKNLPYKKEDILVNIKGLETNITKESNFDKTKELLEEYVLLRFKSKTVKNSLNNSDQSIFDLIRRIKIKIQNTIDPIKIEKLSNNLNNLVEISQERLLNTDCNFSKNNSEQTIQGSLNDYKFGDLILKMFFEGYDNNTLIIVLNEELNYYFQLMISRGKEIAMCEAVSNNFLNKADHLSPQKITWLINNGWLPPVSLQELPNYRKELPIKSKQDRKDLHGFIQKTALEVYGIALDNNSKFTLYLQ